MRQMFCFIFLAASCLGSACQHENDSAATPPPVRSQPQADPSTPAATATPHPTPSRVQNGTWGGEGMTLEVTSSTSTYELDCAHGTIDSPLNLDSMNRFTAVGTITLEHGGPVHEGEPLRLFPARFDGMIVGDVLNLRIRYQTEADSFDTIYRVAHEAQSHLVKCR